MARSYIVNSIDEVGAHLNPIREVEKDGRLVVICEKGIQVPLGVPLCSGCDKPVTATRDGQPFCSECDE